MFYSHSLLSRKGPLGTIWIAAYCFKKLKRGQIDATDISSTVDKIMPEIQISHRVLAQLLLGIVKIFSKKVDFLYVECNETLVQITRYFSPTKGIGQYKASARPKKSVRASKGETSDKNHVTTTMIDEKFDEQIEIMRASYNQVTVTLPERFDLDSFDLGISDDGDIGRHHQLQTPQDEWRDDRSMSPSYLIEGSRHEVVGQSGYNPPCFTPLADILPSGMMDVDLELDETHNSDNFARVQKSLEEFHCSGDLENHDNFSRSVSLGLLHDEIQGSLIPIDHEQAVPSLEEKVLLLEEPRNPRKRNNIQAVPSLEVKVLPLEQPRNLRKRNNLQAVPSLEEKIQPVEEPRNLRKRKKLEEKEPLASGKEKTIRKKHAVALPLDKPKTNLSGADSPKFMLPTPTINESSGVLRKRKKNYIGSIVLLNEVMRQSIHDASDLVCKRRKLPHTDLDIWKFWRLSNPTQLFTEPLIPLSPPKLEKLKHKKSTDGIIDPTEVKGDIPHNSSDAEAETEVLVQELEGKSQYIPEESPFNHLDLTNMEEGQPNIETETEVVIEKLDTVNLTPSNSYDHGANTLENSSKALASPETSDNQFKLVELGFHGDDTKEQDNGFSPSTRAVAKYFYDRFQSLRERKREERLSLAQILEGRTRSKCARFFYETLTLKTCGCIDVKQDVPYGDISVAVTALLESFQTVTR